ncbi:MAG TPA: glycosyltransferase family 39 protein [Clostridia bacterium]|nr:glycosyltransferase family 39 protein [Clostridia bacterium]
MDLNTVIFIFAAALCFSVLIAKHESFNGFSISIKDKTYYTLVFVLFFIACFVRVYKFGSVPAGFNQDGAMAAVDAKALADYGTDRFGMSYPVHFTAWGYGQMSVLLSYLMIPFIKLFGLNAITARLPMLMASLAGIYVLFKFLERIYGRKAAAAVLFIAAINPWHIMQSRWALDCNLLPHFLLFSLYFLHLGLEKRKYLFISMVFFALTMYTYGIAFYSIPLILIALCVYLLVKKLVPLRDIIICAGIYLLIAWPIFAVMVINYFRLDTLSIGKITIPFFPDSIRVNDILFFSDNFFQRLIMNFNTVVNVVFLQKEYLPWNTIAKYGSLYLMSLPFAVIGIFFICARLKQSAVNGHTGSGGVFLLIWFSASIVSGLITNDVNVNRINIIFYPMIIFTGCGLYYVLSQLADRRAVSVAVIALYLLSFVGFNHTYFGEHNRVLANYFYEGFGEAVKYAQKKEPDRIKITTYTQSRNSAHVSEILTLFHGDIDALYFQGKTVSFDSKGNMIAPYSIRYQYLSFSNAVTPEPGTVYVININEISLFDTNQFEINTFGGYAVAIPKH